MKTALVTCGGGFQGLGMVQALRRIDNLHVVVCDIHADSPTRYVCHDYLVCPPLADADAFNDFLLETAKNRHVDFVFPATAIELQMLATLQPKLREHGAIAAVSPPALLDRLLDKHETRRFLAASGLPAEASIDPDTHDYSFPLLGKRRLGWGGRGAIVLASHDAWRMSQTTPAGEALVWSRRFEAFEEYSADFAIGADGAISPIVVRRRTRTSGGFAVISKSMRDPKLDALFTELANLLAQSGGLGCFNAQVIAPQDHQTDPFISDINPRLGTSATHALAEGINLPAFFMADTHDEKTAIPRPPIKNVRLLQDLPLPYLAHRPRGLVLDLDGTLVDHKHWLFAKMERLYAACFRDHIDENTYRLVVAQLIDERDWPRLIDRTLELLALPSSLRNEVIEAYRSIEVDTPLFDDVEPALTALSNEDIQLAILTDNPPATQRSKLAHAPGLSTVKHVVFAREHGGEKPDSAAFQAVAKKLRLRHEELFMVGDNWFRDGVGAIRAGYAHALIIQRGDAQSMAARWFRDIVPGDIANRIHALPNWTCVQHVCLDAPS